MNQGTFPISINAGGEITGMYFDTNNAYHGFLRAADGTITEFDAPGAGTGGHRGTTPLSIDAAGDITGIYTDNSALRHGFMRAANGTITDFDVTGAGTTGSVQGQGTQPLSINSVGDITSILRGRKRRVSRLCARSRWHDNRPHRCSGRSHKRWQRASW